jgi:hypothetical protein
MQQESETDEEPEAVCFALAADLWLSSAAQSHLAASTLNHTSKSQQAGQEGIQRHDKSGVRFSEKDTRVEASCTSLRECSANREEGQQASCDRITQSIWYINDFDIHLSHNAEATPAAKPTTSKGQS